MSNTHLHLRPVAVMLVMLSAAGCDAGTTADVSSASAISPATAAAAAASAAGPSAIVDVVSTGMNLQLPAELPSGWTTFRYANRTDVTHFFVLERMPDGRTVEDSKAEVVPVFDAAMKLIMAGDPAAGFAQFANLPAWFGDVAFVGGVGMTRPGLTAETTVNLQPGTYVIECYVKMPDGTFHTSLGMIEGFVVTAEDSGGQEPAASFDVTIDDTGIVIDGAPQPGRRTFAVHFAGQTVQAHGLGYDVHIASLDDDTDMAALADWMNWSSPAGLSTPAPAEFIGGAQEMPAGETAYVTATLTPGRYALIAEVPDPAASNMLQIFTVPAAARGQGGN